MDVVVNQAAARTSWPDGALHQRFKATFDAPDAPPFTVIGVVADVRHERLASAPGPEITCHTRRLPSRWRDG